MTSSESTPAEDTVGGADLPEQLSGDRSTGTEVSPEVLAARKAELEDVLAMIRPAVQVDGGDLHLVDADYDAGVVEVELQGACGSCAVAGITLTGGVERILKERLDWVTEVIGGVDEEIDQFESAALGRGAYVPKYY